MFQDMLGTNKVFLNTSPLETNEIFLNTFYDSNDYNCDEIIMMSDSSKTLSNEIKYQNYD
jgi:hypothetical protein